MSRGAQKLVALTVLAVPAFAAAPPAPLGSAPDAASLPRAEFVFEERATLSSAVVLGETPFGQRQYIPITGGKVVGPKLNAELIPGGWDYQLRTPGGCQSLSADYFLRTNDGVVIHVLNEAFNCGQGSPGERSYARPRFEAPKGKYDWLTNGTFVGTIDVETSPGAAGAPPKLEAVRIRFYQLK